MKFSNQDQIAKCKDALREAKEDFRSKEEAATIISDDDNEMRDSNTKETAAKILEGLTHMSEGLQQLSAQAEKEHQDEEERKAKRPRGQHGAPASANAASGPPSMQPFGGPGSA